MTRTAQTYTVTSHFGEVLCRGSQFKCWLYAKFWTPVGWHVVVELAR